MAGGRPPKTKQLKKFEGNRSRRDLNYDEPEGLGVPRMPGDLDPVAADCWDAHLSQVVANGAGSGDSLRIGGMCFWFSRFKEFAAISAEEKDPNRKVMFLNSCGTAWNNYSKAASAFGISPTDRARMRTDPKKATSDFDSDVAKNA